MVEKQLLTAALAAREQAHAPYSGFSVGAAILDENDNIHSGCNVENSAYPLGACAEQSAISAMILCGGRRIVKILIVSSGHSICSPCGGCRQRIAEFASAETEILLCSGAQIEQRWDIQQLLPSSFDASHLGLDKPSG